MFIYMSAIMIGFLLFSVGAFGFLVLDWTWSFKNVTQKIIMSLTFICGIVLISSAVHSQRHVIKNAPEYYAIYEVGPVESPIGMSVVKEKTINVTETFRLVLYNPALYYLEEQSFRSGCIKNCLVIHERAPTYRVVPRSLIEEQ